jgi:phage portal protein BeeE
MRRRRVPAARSSAGGASPLDALSRLVGDAVDRRLAGDDLTPWELPVVVASRDLVANTVAQLPLVTYRNGLPLNPQPTVTQRPDPFEPPWLSKHRMVNSLTRHGYVWLIPTAWDAAEWPLAVEVVDAPNAAGTFDPTGHRLVDVFWQGRRLAPIDEAIWCPWRVDGAGSLGSAPLDSCWRAVEYLAALWQMAGSFWEAGFPSLALVIEQALSVTQRRETKAALLDAFRRRHEPAVVDRGGQLVPIGNNAVDSQLVESIETANVEVARAFGIVPSLVNVRASDSLTYSTTEGELSRWLKLGLGQYLTRVEGAFTDLRPAGQVVRADTSELLRTDLAARYAAYSQGLGRWLTVDEVRHAESLPPLTARQLAALPAPGVLPDPQPLPAPFADPVGAHAT